MPIINTAELEVHPEWLMGGNPGAIERQEEQGQVQLCSSSQLPVEIQQNSFSGIVTDPIKVYALKGIKAVLPVGGDPLFLDVVLPAGWKIKIEFSPYWAKLIDAEGREVASIFYKAAFYDRSAFIRFGV